MARLFCTLALLLYVFSFVTLSDIHSFISSPRSCARSVGKWTISSPDKRPKRSALSPHPPTIAYWMTIRAYSNHHLCLFFTSKHPARIPTGTDTNVQRERKSKRCLRAQRIWDEKGYCLAVGWAVWRRSYLNRNAIAASSGLGLSESVETAQGWRRIAESYHKEWYGARDRRGDRRWL